MRILLQNGLVYSGGVFKRTDISLYDGRIDALSSEISFSGYEKVFDVSNFLLFPGLADVHVHLREPGFSYKETIESGTAAAARGGFTTVCTMPNLNPAPDSREGLDVQLEAISAEALINVLPYGCITRGGSGRGELVEYADILHSVAGFSDDGKGVQESDTMERAMREVSKVGGLIAAHCEDEGLLDRGFVRESEWRQVERDIGLVRKTGCNYHVCHVSTKEAVELVRQAKAEGLPVTCETAPHYLVFCEDDIMDHGRFKMNPPLRSSEDRAALIDGIVDGTIDIIATDHAPHSAEEKGKGFEGSAMGVVGLETALPVIYTELVKTGTITAERMVQLMSVNPRKRFGLGDMEITQGEFADLIVFDTTQEYEIDPETFLSKGRATPFEGYRVYGEVVMTFCSGELVWERGEKV